MVTVGFIIVVLVQRVCGWAGFGISWLRFRWLLALLFLAPLRVDSASAGSWVRDARSGRLCLLANALPRGRLLRLRPAENSALWA